MEAQGLSNTKSLSNWFNAPKSDNTQETEAEKWKKTNVWDVAAGMQGCAYMN